MASTDAHDQVGDLKGLMFALLPHTCRANGMSNTSIKWLRLISSVKTLYIGYMEQLFN
jgi:hypothetical protein